MTYLRSSEMKSNQLSQGLSTVRTFNSCTSRPEVCQCLVIQTPMDNMSKNKSSTSQAHVACASKLCSFVRSSMPRRVAVGCAVVYHAFAAHTIKCRHCRAQARSVAYDSPGGLTLPMLRLLPSKVQGRKIFENHLNPVMLVFIG